MSTVYSKTELAQALYLQRGDLTQQQCREVVRTLFDQVLPELLAHAPVQIKGFGCFRLARRPARAGRNPATGETVQLPATLTPRFQPSTRLKRLFATANSDSRSAA